MVRTVHTIDAKGRVMGRLASEIAMILRGKHKVTFQPHLDEGDIVNVMNVDKIKVTGKKLVQKYYYHHSGQVGGLKETQMKKMLAEKPEVLFRGCVYNMLPKNKLRSAMIKRLHFVK